MQAKFERRDPVRLFARRMVLLGLAILLLFAVFGVWGIYRKDRQAAALNQEAQAQLADLVQRERELNAKITELQTARGMEAAVREQYDMAKDGEHLIVIVNPQTPKPIEATSTPFQKWLHKAFPWW